MTGVQTCALPIWVNIPVICDSISSAVRYKLTQATGVKVRNVDVFVDSVMPE